MKNLKKPKVVKLKTLTYYTDNIKQPDYKMVVIERTDNLVTINGEEYTLYTGYIEDLIKVLINDGTEYELGTTDYDQYVN